MSRLLVINWLCLLLGFCLPSFAQWGNDGEITTDILDDDVIRAAVFDAQGRIVAVGRTIQTNFNMFAVARYWPDGTLDSTFSADGMTTTRLSINQPAGVSYAWAHDVVIDSSDRIVAVGRVWTGSHYVGGDGYNFAVTRYLTDGTLDTTFATDGILDIDMGHRKADFARSVAIQTDGDIVIGGYSMNSAGNYDFAWARILSTGAMDTTLDSDGIVRRTVGLANDVVHGMLLSSDSQKVVLAGYYDNAGTDNFAIAVFNNDGSMHTAFDNDGVATSAPGSGHSRAYDLNEDVGQNQYNVVGRSNNGSNHDAQRVRWNDADGSINFSHTFAVGTGAEILHSAAIEDNDTEAIVAGRIHNGTNWDFLVTRVDHDVADVAASFDTSTNYTYPIRAGNDSAFDVAYDNKKIVAVGRSRDTDYDFALLRFNSDGTIATAGSLDVNFQGNGIYKQAYGNDSTQIRHMALTSDGGFVGGGWTEIGGSGGDNRDNFLIRFTADGSLDNTFGTAGALHRVGEVGGQRDEGQAIAIDTQGRIVLVGHSEQSNGDSRRLVVERYLEDGAVDTTFTADGRVREQFPTNDQTHLHGVAIGTDNRVIGVGFRENGGAGTQDTCIAVYYSDGNVDTSFSADGKTTIDGTDAGGRDRALTVALASNGDIVTAGFGRVDADNNANREDWILTKHLTDGNIDTTFSNDGIAIHNFNSSGDRAQGMVIDTEGRIVVVGHAEDDVNNDDEWAVMRFLADGQHDSTFSNDAVVTNDTGADTTDDLDAVVVQANGRIVAVGESNDDFLIIRLESDGAFDTTFDNDGERVIDDGGVDELFAMVLTTDGRYIAGGRAEGDSSGVIALWP